MISLCLCEHNQIMSLQTIYKHSTGMTWRTDHRLMQLNTIHQAMTRNLNCSANVRKHDRKFTLKNKQNIARADQTEVLLFGELPTERVQEKNAWDQAKSQAHINHPKSKQTSFALTSEFKFSYHLQNMWTESLKATLLVCLLTGNNHQTVS